MKRFALLLAVFCLNPLAVFAADSLLPQNFAGWEKSKTAKQGDNPALVDPAFPAVLKEYGFHDFESAEYTRGERHITIKAARFANVTGAYGAFTVYRTAEMQREEIGAGAASANARILFYRSNVLVDASLDKVTAMSASDLRELAKDLPVAHGNDATLPNLPGYLPKERAVLGTSHYVIGPEALALVHAPITSDQVNYQKYGPDAEVMLSDYKDQAQRSTMVIVRYPTREIAAERLKNFEATMQNLPGFISKRSESMVILMTGDLPMSEEKALVGSVNFDATVSWTEATSVTPRNNVGNLIVAAFGLIGILLVIGVVFGVVFGGARVLVQRYLPGRFHKGDEGDFTSLDLR
jgi:hypothetical protein